MSPTAPVAGSLAPRVRPSHKQEKAAMRVSYRQLVNRWGRTKKAKTGSNDKAVTKKQKRGDTVLVMDEKGHKTWRRKGALMVSELLDEIARLTAERDELLREAESRLKIITLLGVERREMWVAKERAEADLVAARASLGSIARTLRGLVTLYRGEILEEQLLRIAASIDHKDAAAAGEEQR